MKTNPQQKLDELENVVHQTVVKLTELEGRKIELPEILIPDYTEQFKELKNITTQNNLAYHATQIQAQILELKKQAASLPKVIPVRHHHHIDDKSKGFLISAAIILLVCAISVGVAVAMWKENYQMNENSVKFRMIRQTKPSVAYWADTTYFRDREFMDELTKKLEAEQLATAQAEAAGKQSEEELKASKEKTRKLKDKLVK
ncbi:hypothetical protein [Hufsiella ginkgonis]|uniref:Uncharacterized protein n=1 Tax=Hufsiella ginkgonis TaxID=2695274 RepID=A0A7K1XSN6_9SPHI|nr:hypothetical protein [Hufsiella ginkgonis]MXV14015.1 hypothetical protein [Hufsiella ginkgonis]